MNDYNNLESLLEKLKGTEKDILTKYLNGKSQLEIAEEYNVTRQAISKRILSIISYFPTIEIDSYKSIFEKYNFLEDEFTKIFNEDKIVYRFLCLKYRKGKSNIKELLENKFIAPEDKRRISSVLKLNYIVIGENVIIKNRAELLEYVIRAANETLTSEILKEKYYKCLKDFPPTDIQKYNYSDNYFQIVAPKLNILICERNSKFRYYDSSLISEKELVENLKLKNYINENIIISSKLLYNENLPYMKKIDIRNFEELHNLLKKKKLSEYNLKVGRMPNMIFGKITIGEQITNFLKANNFSSIDEFGFEFEKKYGLNSFTVKQENYKLIRKNLKNL